jgi:hypothetical protein
MVFTPWNTAHGDASPELLRVEDTVVLDPLDDSVDTNTVILEGAGTITSFGPSSRVVMKRVKFVPLVLIREGEDPGPQALPTIILVNSPMLNLLSGQQRSMSKVSYGMYLSNGSDHWDEVYFVQKGTALANDLEDRMNDLEARLSALEAKVFG